MKSHVHPSRDKHTAEIIVPLKRNKKSQLLNKTE